MGRKKRPELDINRLSIGDMKKFCRVYANVRKGKESLNAICQLVGVHEKFLQHFEAQLRPPGAQWHLVDRAPNRAARPTDEGIYIEKQFNHLLEWFKNAMEGEKVGRKQVRIMAPRMAVRTFVADAYDAFSKDDPDGEAELAVSNAFSTEIVQAVRDRRVHVGIGYVETNLADVEEVELLITPLVVVRARNKPFVLEEKGKPFSRGWLAHETVMTLQEESVYHLRVNPFLPVPVDEIKKMLVLPGAPELLEWTRRGLGVSIMFRCYVGSEVESGVKAFPLPDVPPITIWLYLRHDWRTTLPKHVQDFVRYIKEAAAKLSGHTP